MAGRRGPTSCLANWSIGQPGARSVTERGLGSASWLKAEPALCRRSGLAFCEVAAARSSLLYCWKSASKTLRRSSATSRKPSKSSAKFSHRSMMVSKAACCTSVLTVCGGACGAETASIETACCRRRPLCCVIKARCGTRVSVHTPRSIRLSKEEGSLRCRVASLASLHFLCLSDSTE